MGSGRILLSLGVALALAGPASARSWVVDPTRSMLGFEGTETGTAFRGRFERWHADITYEPAAPAAATIRVTIDIGSGATGERRRDEAMLGEDWLGAAAFPQAVYEATGFRVLGAGRFETAGALTLRGQRRTSVLSFSLVEIDTGIRARGETMLVRTRFGIGRGQWSGPQVVGIDVKIVFDLVARRAE